MGLLSDAAESMVNLVAAIVALVSLTIAARPPARPADDDHHFGHSKAEYFSAALEGIMIFVAAASIIYLGIDRLLNPRPLGSLGIGLAVSIMAAVLNGIVGRILIKVGTRHRSITLRADGKHLMADVYTSVGVVVGLGLAWLTGWNWLDPVIAILVGVNILVVGYRLMSESASGLMDATLSPEDNARIQASWTRTPNRAGSNSTPCARASPGPASSWRCTCWCPATGRCCAGMTPWKTWWRRSWRSFPPCA